MSKNQEMIELNLEIIRAAAEPKWADNWNFRAYLQQEVDPELIDQEVARINHEVSQQIDCTKCGNCCREIQPVLDEDEVARLAQGTRQSRKQLKKMMEVEINPGQPKLYRFSSMPCPLLIDGRCSCYKARPRDCRQYPHLHKSNFLGGSIGTIENYGTCPIIYNVYNRLKHSFKYDPLLDYIGDSDPESV